MKWKSLKNFLYDDLKSSHFQNIFVQKNKDTYN